MTARLLTAHGPDRLVACWDDDWRPAFRVEALPSYKAHRVAAEGGEEVPDELSPQVPILVDVLAAAGIDRVGAPGFEADDVIGTLATRARPAGRHRHRRPRPVPARRRRPRRAGAVHEPGHRRHRDGRRGRRRRQVRHPGPRLRRLRRPPRGPQRRAAGRGRGRRQDGRGPDQRVRRPGRHPGGRRAHRRRQGSPHRRRAEEAARGRGLPRPRARGGRRGEGHRHARGGGDASPSPRPDALAELAGKHGLQSSLGRLGAALRWPADALG